MNRIDLNHSETPSQLSDLNYRIAELLDAEHEEENRYQEFLELIERRDAIVTEHLSQLSTDDKKLFAKNELAVNNLLKEVAQTLLVSAKGDISHFVKSQSAIRKYK